MPNPPKKKTKTTSRKRQTSAEQDEANERTFTACHILCGNLDRQLCNGDDAPVEVRRARLVLTLLHDGDEEDEIEHEYPYSGWDSSLEVTRSNVRLVRSCKGASKLQDRLHHLLRGDHVTMRSKHTTELFRGPISSSAHIHIANSLIDQALGVADDIGSAQRLYIAAVFFCQSSTNGKIESHQGK